MKLIEIIAFATQHNQFKLFMQQHNFDPDRTNQLTARLVKVDLNFSYIEIFLDFGTPGPGLGEVRVRSRYVRQSGSFIFDEIAIWTPGFIGETDSLFAL